MGSPLLLLASDPLWGLFFLSTSLSNPFHLWPWEPIQRVKPAFPQKALIKFILSL